jgi:hypothetical protein
MGLWDKIKNKTNEVVNQARVGAAPQPAAPQQVTSEPAAQEGDAALESEAAEDTPEDEADDSIDLGQFDADDVDTYWERVFQIEAAGNRGDAELEQELARHGLQDKAHFDRVREFFNNRYGHDTAFSQAGLDARGRMGKREINARMEQMKGEMAPVEGVTLEQWAWVMAKIASGGNHVELLKIASMDQPKWDRVSAEWNARMSRDTTATIATAYGQAFVATGPGPFGDAGKAAAASMLDASQSGVAGKEPISLEKWVEITEAQSAAANQGMDAGAVLRSYGMTPADWGTVSSWWSQHFSANAMKLLGDYNRFSEKYKEKFAKGFSADKIEF